MCLKKLLEIKIHKQRLNKFISYLTKKANFPKLNKIEIKPKYIVQTDDKIPKFKVFINIKKVPYLFQKYFDNAFRGYFKLREYQLSTISKVQKTHTSVISTIWPDTFVFIK